MSAFVVDPQHIHVMIWAANHQAACHLGPMRWTFANPTQLHQLDDDNLDQVGQMLVEENTASVNYRYDEDNPPYTYTYHHPQHIGWSVPELLNAVHCYEYQACEHPAWERSEAYALSKALQSRLIARLPG